MAVKLVNCYVQRASERQLEVIRFEEQRPSGMDYLRIDTSGELWSEETSQSDGVCSHPGQAKDGVPLFVTSEAAAQWLRVYLWIWMNLHELPLDLTSTVHHRSTKPLYAFVPHSPYYVPTGAQQDHSILSTSRTGREFQVTLDNDML